MSKIYTVLSGIRLTSKSYTLKFLFIAFLGIHIPLIGLILLFASSFQEISFGHVILITLLLTLIATALTLVILRLLLSPLHISNEALKTYVSEGKVPSLPLYFNDEAGCLMKNIQKTIEQVEGLLQQQRDLMSLLSHDVRSPLLGAIGMLDMTLQLGNEQEKNDNLKLLRAELQKQLYYMDEMLVALHQESAELNSKDFREIPVHSIIENAIESVDVRYDEKGIELFFFKEANPKVRVHPTFAHEVLVNILTNALKFSSSGGRVLVSVSQQRNECMIHVKDTGLGFDKLEEQKIFQRSAGAGRLGTAGEKSTGIGLYLSRKIMRQMGGDIMAFSEGEGRGATFSILMPVSV